jgi:hypothetical protein
MIMNGSLSFSHFFYVSLAIYMQLIKNISVTRASLSISSIVKWCIYIYIYRNGVVLLDYALFFFFFFFQYIFYCKRFRVVLL